MISEIITWVQNPNRDYYLGVMLYDEYGKSDILKNLFKNGKDSYTTKKLFEEVKKLSPVNVPIKKTAERPSFAVYSTKKKPSVSRELLPERLKALDIKKSELVNEARYYKVLMTNLPRSTEYNKERRLFAVDIEWCFDCVDAIWKEINYFLANGYELPISERVNLSRSKKSETPDFSELSELQLHKKLTSARSALYRAKKEKKSVRKYLLQIEELTKLLAK
jgi:hypothetical protein